MEEGLDAVATANRCDVSVEQVDEWRAAMRRVRPDVPADFASEWRTETVWSITREMRETGDFTVLPILATRWRKPGEFASTSSATAEGRDLMPSTVGSFS